MRRTILLTAIMAAALSACAPMGGHVTGAPAVAAAETISVSVGPCFGFCPVYDVAVSPAGEISFSGKRHTALIGDRKRKGGNAVSQAVARELLPFRPADGTSARVDCTAAISDTSSYTITWTSAAGLQTTATHQKGCTGGLGQALDSVLARLPDKLGIAAWAKQTTRPGASRG